MMRAMRSCSYVSAMCFGPSVSLQPTFDSSDSWNMVLVDSLEVIERAFGTGRCRRVGGRGRASMMLHSEILRSETRVI